MAKCFTHELWRWLFLKVFPNKAVLILIMKCSGILFSPNHQPMMHNLMRVNGSVRFPKHL